MHTFESTLAHYGVKGMKWGRRRTRAELDADSADVSQVKSAKAKIKSNRGSTDSLSNKDLQSVVTRMNLERQYKQLAPSTGGDKARKFAADLILNVGKQQATKVVNDIAAQQVSAALNRKN